MEIVEPTVEMRDNPEGVASFAPRFSWQLATGKQDVMQTAYQIEVADSEKSLQTGAGLVWKSIPTRRISKVLQPHGCCFFISTLSPTLISTKITLLQIFYIFHILNFYDYLHHFRDANNPHLDYTTEI